VLIVPAGLPPSALIEAGNFLNSRIRGKPLAELRTEIEKAVTEGQAELDQLTQKIIATGSPVGRAARRGSQADRARPRQSARRSAMRLTNWSECARCSMRWRASGVIDCSAAPSAPTACASSSVRKTSCFSLSGSSTIVAPTATAGRIVAHRRHRPTTAQLCPRHPMVDYTAGCRRLLGG